MKKFTLTDLENSLQNGEKFVNIVTPRFLVLACVLSIVDLLTLGKLATFWPIMWGWAIIQGMAVEATLPEMWRRSANSFQRSVTSWIRGVTIGLIALTLSVVVFFALAIQFTQQSTGVSLPFAMKSLGVNEQVLSYIRAASVVFLTAVLSILNRTKQQTIVLSPNVESSVENSQSLPENSTEQPTELYKTPPNKREITTELHEVKSDAQWRIYTALETNPDLRIPGKGTQKLAEIAGVSKGYASQMKNKWLAEQQEDQLSS